MDKDVDLATFTCSGCQYHRNHALTVQNLTLTHDGGRLLFHATDVVVKHGSITGLVGANGAGKTSLARVLASKHLPGFPESLNIEYLAASDEEEFLAGFQDDYESMLGFTAIEYIQNRISVRSNQLRSEIETLESNMESGDENDVEEIANRLSDLYDVEEALAEKVHRELDAAIKSLGLIKYVDVGLSTLSSGWRYKCQLVAALLVHPDLLIVDEPSYLDKVSTEWFVTQMLEAAKTDGTMILLISHKETLLDSLCDNILYINSANQSITSYHCSYSTFRASRELDVQHAARSVEDTEKNLETAEKSLKQLQITVKGRERNFKAITSQNADKRFIKGKNKEAKQKSDRSAAAKLKQVKRQVGEMEDMKLQARKERTKPLDIHGVPAGGTAVTLVDVAAGYDDSLVFENVDVCIEATDRVLLVGPNGCGKSTLVRLIMGELEPVRGSVMRTENVLYFPQTALSRLLRKDGSTTARDFLGDHLTETDARRRLGDFGLSRDLATRPISTLSAGQRVRLWLAQQLMLHPKPALIVVDEISENVDTGTRDSLIETLSNFEGAVLVISHDQDFRDTFQPTKIWNLCRYGIYESYDAEVALVVHD